jgi:hypothetical protein
VEHEGDPDLPEGARTILSPVRSPGVTFEIEDVFLDPEL